MITQIYSIQTPAEAELCIAAGAEHIGVAIATGSHLPAEVSVETCAEIFKTIGTRAKKILIVVTDDPEPVFEPLRVLKPDILHICGNRFAATPEFADLLHSRFPGMKLLQAVGMDGPEAVKRAQDFAQYCDYLILDSVDPSIAGIGAAGITHDWSWDAQVVQTVRCPVILAGGLDASNVKAAIRAVRPWGVDSFTRTSDKLPSGGTRKNPEKVQAFIKAAKEAALELGL